MCKCVKWEVGYMSSAWRKTRQVALFEYKYWDNLCRLYLYHMGKYLTQECSFICWDARRIQSTESDLYRW